MPEVQTFLQLTKYDPFLGKFWATATQGGVKDRAGERLDYFGSKPYFEKVVASQSAATDGVNKFPVRLQHNPKHPAGLINVIKFDDANQTIEVQGTAVDPITKELLAQRVLTGVSIGGGYVKKTVNPKDGVVDYIANPSEISLVDRPCLPEATFKMVKNAQGEEELCKFASPETSETLIEKYFPKGPDMTELEKRIEELTKSVTHLVELQKRDFTTDERKKLAEEGKALPDGSFPIANAKDLENAIHDIGRASDPAKAKAHIIARAKALGEEAMLPEDWQKVAKADEKQTTDPLSRDEVNKNMNTEELTKAHKSVLEHVAAVKKAASDHREEMHKAASDHEAAIHDGMDKIAKCIGAEPVAMEVTKNDKSKEEKAEDMNKADNITDEQLAALVTGALNKALGIEEPKKPVTLEERVAKAVSDAIAPLMKSDPRQAKPRFVQPQTSEEVQLTEAERKDLAKRAAAGDREAISKMFRASGEQMAKQAN